MSNESVIVSNLKGRVNFVNPMCATHGIDNLSEGLEALQGLVSDGVVEVNRVPLPNGNSRQTVAMYRLKSRAPFTKADLSIVS